MNYLVITIPQKYTSRAVTNLRPIVHAGECNGLGTNNPNFFRDLADLSSPSKSLHYLCQCVSIICKTVRSGPVSCCNMVHCVKNCLNEYLFLDDIKHFLVITINYYGKMIVAYITNHDQSKIK